ncbi:MAG: hypothetical protein IJ887_17320 [Prevotella sp.]|nr:hypothetical protein [Prevotella sp.]
MFCYQKSFLNPTLPVDEAQFFALVRGTQWNENIDKFRQTGDQSLKRRLPAFIFQATFDETESKKGRLGRWRKQAATRLTGLVVMDIDHVDEPHTLYQGWVEKGLDWKEQGIVLIYITPSGKGLKVVFKARLDWGNLIDNQHAMAKVLGVEVDESCKDASRMSFICKESDILHIDKELFTYEDKEFAERYDKEYRKGNSRETLPPAPPCMEGSNMTVGEVSTPLPHREGTGEGPTFKGIPYSEIISAWWKRNGGEPQEGERNVKLYQLAVNLRAICDNDKALLLQVMPRLGLDEQEIVRIVESACKEPPKGLSKPMREILGVNAAAATSEQNISQMLWTWGGQIEALMQDYPLLLDICKGLKRNQYPAALFVGGGLMMTLMTRCTYRFYHRPEELRRLNNSTLIIGDPASGKSFATRLFKLLAAPIVAADKVGKDAINAYRELMKTKGANKEKPKKPKVVVRVHPARTSNAQFIQDMVNAVEVVDGEEMQLHMLTFDTELDNTVTVQKGGSWIDKQSLELKAFHNEEDGQAYSNIDSILQDFYVTWNFIYTGTPIALKKKVNEQNFGSGLATRLSVIPLPATNFEMMTRESNVDYESDARLKAWAEKLDKTKGLLPLDKIVDELYDWTAHRMMDAQENDSKADEMLLKRCAYHGLNFSAPFIVMRHWDKMRQDGDLWCGTFETDATDWKLAELITNIQFACQRHYFGAMAESYFDNKLKDASVNVQRRQKTFEGFSRLPEEFSIEDVVRCFNLSSEASARKKVTRLQRDHLVEKVREERGQEKALYRKTSTMML